VLWYVLEYKNLGAFVRYFIIRVVCVFMDVDIFGRRDSIVEEVERWEHLMRIGIDVPRYLLLQRCVCDRGHRMTLPRHTKVCRAAPNHTRALCARES
jgi:hypothetical protein